MKITSELTPEIIALAEKLGAKRRAIYKWADRGVPAKWQIILRDYVERAEKRRKV